MAGLALYNLMHTLDTQAKLVGKRGERYSVLIHEHDLLVTSTFTARWIMGRITDNRVLPIEFGVQIRINIMGILLK